MARKLTDEQLSMVLGEVDYQLTTHPYGTCLGCRLDDVLEDVVCDSIVGVRCVESALGVLERDGWA